MDKALLRLPPLDDTEFIVRIPHGLTPQQVTAGYDAPDDSDDLSFMLDLKLDWSADAPHIKKADLFAYPGYSLWLTIPRAQISLTTGPGLAQYDQINEEENSFLCYVRMRPIERITADR